VGCWRGYVSGSRCRFAYGLADAAATHCLLLQKMWIGFTFLVPAHLGSPGRAIKWLCVFTGQVMQPVTVCVSVVACLAIVHWSQSTMLLYAKPGYYWVRTAYWLSILANHPGRLSLLPLHNGSEYQAVW